MQEGCHEILIQTLGERTETLLQGGADANSQSIALHLQARAVALGATGADHARRFCLLTEDQDLAKALLFELLINPDQPISGALITVKKVREVAAAAQRAAERLKQEHASTSDAQLTELRSSVAELEAKNAQHIETARQKDSELQASSQAVSNLETQLKGKDKRVKKLESDVAQQQQYAGAATKKAKDLSTQLTQATRDLEATNAGNQDLGRRVQELNEEVTTLHRELEAAMVQVRAYAETEPGAGTAAVVSSLFGEDTTWAVK